MKYSPLMLFAKITALILCSIGIMPAFAQSPAFQPVVFTWEGATLGNKAVWKADDTENTYTDLEGVDVNVKIIDGDRMNTTTSNPGYPSGCTKSNAVFEAGSLAFQIKSSQSGKPVCIKFAFSKPVYLRKFTIFDIDREKSGLEDGLSYQDSVSFSASNAIGDVPLKLRPMVDYPNYTIYNQSVVANRAEGDLQHTDPSGAVQVTSSAPVESFIVYFSNGHGDEGLSKNLAIKITEFEFAELLGKIEGHVKDFSTKQGLRGSVIKLMNADDELATNKEGWFMQSITDEDGRFTFDYMPMGSYRIQQINPVGFRSISDSEGPNDNSIRLKLDVRTSSILNNTFYEAYPKAVLATQLKQFEVVRLEDNNYRINWEVVNGKGDSYFVLSTTDDGLHFVELGRIDTDQSTKSQYYNDFNTNLNLSPKFVYLSEITLEGKVNQLGIKELNQESQVKKLVAYPNPFSQVTRVDIPFSQVAYNKYEIRDNGQRIVMEGKIDMNQGEVVLDLSMLPAGMYYFVASNGQSSLVSKLVKS
jgi:hypothetical protein